MPTSVVLNSFPSLPLTILQSPGRSKPERVDIFALFVHVKGRKLFGESEIHLHGVGKVISTQWAELSHLTARFLLPDLNVTLP